MPRSTRRYLRSKGHNVPKLKPGPRKGYKQTQEHIDAKTRTGEGHHAWKGDGATEKAGRSRALRMYAARPCASCAVDRAERHHLDGNTLNNAPENIVFLCRKCHMRKDGRLDEFKKLAVANQPKAVAARWG